MPMPKPFSRIQLDCARLLTPPAPAKTRPVSTRDTGRTLVSGNCRCVIGGRSAQADMSIAAMIAITRKTSVRPTLKNCAGSSV